MVRELFVLGRRFDEAGPLGDPVLPDGLVARAFRPGRDEDEWLRVNAAAFAHHAEQGRMTRADLDARMDEPWFDPAGLILVVPESDPDTVAAFHWTKIGQAHGRRHGAARDRGGVRRRGRPRIPGQGAGPARDRAGPGVPARPGRRRTSSSTSTATTRRR